jgi:signal peptidase II
VWAEWYFADNGPLEIGTYLTLSPTYNQGISFGMFQGIGQIVGWLSIFIVIGLLVYLKRTPKSMRLLRIGLALLIGGAIGNMVDRIISGEVLDFIQTIIRSGVFNVADILVNVGMVLSLLGLIFQKEESEVGEPEDAVEEVNAT